MFDRAEPGRERRLLTITRGRRAVRVSPRTDLIYNRVHLFLYAVVKTMPEAEYLLTSDRLGFRLLEDSDFADLETLDTNPEVRAYFPDGVLTPEQIRERISANKTCFEENGFADFAVIDLETGNFTGRAGFGRIEHGEIEVGYVFLKDYWGRGLAQESLRALLDWAGQNLEVQRIVAYAPRHHSASFNVMKKSGMQYFKTDRMRGTDCDFYEYFF